MGCEFRVDRQFGRMGDIIFLCRFFDVALAEDGQFFMTMRTFKIAHVFDEAQDWDVHHFRHVQCFFDDHGNEFLRRCDDQDAVHGQGLEDRQRDVARSRRHVDEHVVDIAPDDIGPELLYCAGNDRAAPYDRSRCVFEQEVHGHDLDARLGRYRIDTVFIARSVVGQAEDFRNRRARDIGIEDSRLEAAALHFNSHEGRYQGFTDAAFAADDSDDMLDVRAGMRSSLQALGLCAFSAGAAAAGTVVCAIFTHWDHSPLCYFFRRGSRYDNTCRNVHKLGYGRLR